MIKLLELDESKKVLRLLLVNISESINNKSSKTPYKELSIEEKIFENKLLMV